LIRFRVIGSGSAGNATLVEGGGARVLLDAGLGPRQLAERLQSAGVDPASLDAVLLSHEHGDHARGAFAFAVKWGMPLAGTRGTQRAAAFETSRLPGYLPLEPGESRSFRRLTARAVGVPHDAARPLAFVLSEGQSCFGHATDLGHVSRGLVEAFRECDALLVESNYDPSLLRDGPYPWALKERILGPFGHLSNEDVARFLEKGMGAFCARVVLAHLSQKNNHAELALMSAEDALRRAGRREVAVTSAAPEGTDWITVPARAAGKDRTPPQLRLF
jgi:phosphoribosyl 1,2-cyclic phosphodiesterase